MASNDIFIVIGTILILVIIAGTFLVIGNKPQQSGATATISVSTNTNVSNKSSTVTTINTTQTVQGSNSIPTSNAYLTKTQFEQFAGSNGTYSSKVYLGSNISSIYGGALLNSTYTKFNITQASLTYYNITTYSANNALIALSNIEFVINTNTPNTFMDLIKSRPSFSYIKFNVTNITENGMTYDYAGVGNSFKGQGLTLLYGYNSNHVVMFISGQYISQQELAAAISSDLNG